MADVKKICYLFISAACMAAILYLLLGEIYSSKSYTFIVLLLIAMVLDGMFFIRTFFQLTSGYKDGE